MLRAGDAAETRGGQLPGVHTELEHRPEAGARLKPNDDLMSPQRLPHFLSRHGTRRDFLVWSSGAAGLIMLGTLPGRRGDAIAKHADYPFTLGVASGDPSSTGVVLWTRLAPDPLQGGGMPGERLSVRWEIAQDEGFSHIVQHGDVLALPDLGHAVHVEVEGLDADRVYWYRFISGGEASPPGRTKTAPAESAALERLTFAFASCQHYEGGFYTAYEHMAAEELDLVVHLGDYIYEAGISDDGVRQHNSPEILTLNDYRNRYALYKSDPHLQAAHAAFPWAVTWDDHEVDNNYAAAIDQDDTDPEVFLLRRAMAYQAYYEHMPLRRRSMPRGPDLRLYRRLRFGDLAEINMLDTRQYRTDQPCGDGIHMDCEEREDQSATLLGEEQERWLVDGLARSRTRWNVLGNQVPLATAMRRNSSQAGYSMDKWDGYVVARERLLTFLAERNISNPIVITGDVHRSWVAELSTNSEDPSAPVLGTEFVGTSISSAGDGSEMTEDGEALLQDNPHVRFFNAQRGYGRCTVTPRLWTTEYRVVEHVTRPSSPIRTAATFAVEDGGSGVSAA